MAIGDLKTVLRNAWHSMCEAAKLSYWVLSGDYAKLETYSSEGYVVDSNGNKRPLTEEEHKLFMAKADAMLREGKAMLDEGQRILKTKGKL